MRNTNKPVVALDIDGTLGDYHGHFLRFAEGWTGKSMPPSDQVNPGMQLHKFMGVSKDTYRRVKLAYRRGGMKRSMPCYPRARMLTTHLRKNGAHVWICTTRPYLAMENIDEDTRHWLRRHGIQYDEVLWGEHKYRNLVKYVDKDNIIGVLDDLPAMIEQADVLGLNAYVRTQPYNRHMDDTWYKRVDDLSEACFELMTELNVWKENHGKRI